MASRRSLKKDIRFLANDLFTNSYLKQAFFDNVDQDKLAEVVVKSVDFQNQLLAKANHPDAKDNPKMVKDYYKKLRKEMMEKYVSLSEDLNNL